MNCVLDSCSFKDGFALKCVLLQFSVTEHFRDADVYPKPPPGVYFIYDFSPIKVSKK